MEGDQRQVREYFVRLQFLWFCHLLLFQIHTVKACLAVDGKGPVEGGVDDIETRGDHSRSKSIKKSKGFRSRVHVDRLAFQS